MPISPQWVDNVNKKYETYGDFDSYELDPEPIGVGGFAKVYRAVKDGKEYAMKIPLSVNPKSDTTLALEQSDLREFMGEANNWAIVSKKAPSEVVCLEDYNVEPFPWMVMELATESYAEHIESGEASVGDFVDLLYALDKVHEAGIVHRDIKPENILLVHGRWKFSDFGLSRKISSMSSSSVGMKGTPQYMAPEQVSRKRYGSVDPRTDMWQMAILLYRVMMGRFPYPTEDVGELSLIIPGDGPDFNDVPPEYLGLFSKALSQQKDDRFPRAKQFADSLEKIYQRYGAPALGMAGDNDDFRKANLSSNVSSKYKMAMQSLDNGKYSEAIRMLTDCAEYGHIQAQVQLGYMYSVGLGTNIEGRKAIDWFLRAAAQNDNTAQYNLAVIYAQGKLTLKDYTKAMDWCVKAKANGNTDADRLIKILTKAQKRMKKKGRN